jgi:hypothetical protein
LLRGKTFVVRQAMPHYLTSHRLRGPKQNWRKKPFYLAVQLFATGLLYTKLFKNTPAILRAY